MMQIGMYHRDRHARRRGWRVSADGRPVSVASNRATRQVGPASRGERRKACKAALRAWAAYERRTEQGAAELRHIAQPERRQVPHGGAGLVGALLVLALGLAFVVAAVARLGVGR